METKITDILKDLLETEPSLADKEPELKKLIKKLLSSRPETKIDPSFQSKLKEQLMRQFSVRQQKKQLRLLQWLKMKSVQKILGGAVLSVLIVMVSLNLYQQKKTKTTFNAYVYIEENTPAESREESSTIDLDQGALNPQAIEKEKSAPEVDKKKTLGLVDEKPLKPEIEKRALETTAIEDVESKLEYSADQEKESILEEQQEMADSEGATEEKVEKNRINLFQKLKKEKSLSIQSKKDLVTSDSFTDPSPKKAPSPVQTIHKVTQGYSLLPSGKAQTPLAQPRIDLPADIPGGSWIMSRSLIQKGSMTPAPGISLLGMIQHFDYKQPVPRGDLSFTTDIVPAAWDQDRFLLRVSYKSKKIIAQNQTPHDLVLIIQLTENQPYLADILRDAIWETAKTLRGDDTLSLIFTRQTGVSILEPTGDLKKIMSSLALLEGANKAAGHQEFETALQILDRFKQPGSRQSLVFLGDSPLMLSERLAKSIALIPQKDITFAMADISGTERTLSQYEKISAAIGIQPSTFSEPNTLRSTLQIHLDYDVPVIGSGFRYSLQFNPAVVKDYKLLGIDDTLPHPSKEETVLYAGEETTLLFELTLHDEASLSQIDLSRVKSGGMQKSEAATLQYTYTRPDQMKIINQSITIPLDITDPDQAGPDMQFLSALRMWDMLLRDDPDKGNSSLSLVIDLAGTALQYDPMDLKNDFLEHIKKSRSQNYLKNMDSSLELMETK